ncbi:MAG: GNAT family N-acetyltransferase [Chloroflexi bacterium]|nr:GNAT family N-acetyltransferase [Chloroflexota bacterium]MDA1147041.1 GNAT family N-acetyltransferase [Chloroflexota bacterium]
MSVALVTIPEEEFDDFFELFADYHDEMSEYDDDPEDTDAYLERYRPAMLADLSGRELYWIEVDGETAGFVVARYLPDWPHEERMVASIAEFYVDPDFRRANVGTEAVEILLAEHRDRGTYLVEADILRANEPAKAFWYGLGFELQFHQTGRKP